MVASGSGFVIKQLQFMLDGHLSGRANLALVLELVEGLAALPCSSAESKTLRIAAAQGAPPVPGSGRAETRH